MSRLFVTRSSRRVALGVAGATLALAACSSSPETTGTGASGPASTGATSATPGPAGGVATDAPSSPGASGASTTPGTTASPGASDASGAAPSPSGSTSASPTAARAAQLPRGGRRLFPAYRLVGFSGAPGAEALGKLGIGDIDDRAEDIEEQAKPYARGRKIMPVFELIATLSHRTPGSDGNYSTRADDDVVKDYLAAARRAKGILLINIQPGRADFLPEVKAYERWLREPDVGLALDPEWAVDDDQVPGRSYGNTSGRELDTVARYVSDLVAENDLPEKALVFHQVALSVVRDEKSLRPHPGVALIKSVDGIGDPDLKRGTWRVLTRRLADHVRPGFKLFYVEDTEGASRLMTPREVMALEPTPDYVLYE